MKVRNWTVRPRYPRIALLFLTVPMYLMGRVLDKRGAITPRPEAPDALIPAGYIVVGAITITATLLIVVIIILAMVTIVQFFIEVEYDG